MGNLVTANWDLLQNSSRKWRQEVKKGTKGKVKEDVEGDIKMGREEGRDGHYIQIVQ